LSYSEAFRSNVDLAIPSSTVGAEFPPLDHKGVPLWLDRQTRRISNGLRGRGNTSTARNGESVPAILLEQSFATNTSRNFGLFTALFPTTSDAPSTSRCVCVSSAAVAFVRRVQTSSPHLSRSRPRAMHAALHRSTRTQVGVPRLPLFPSSPLSPSRFAPLSRSWNSESPRTNEGVENVSGSRLQR
jgi:hypothetical protein